MRIFKKSAPVNEKRKLLEKIISEKSFTYRPISKVIKGAVKSNSKILDIGCGEGNVSLLLAKKNNNVTGIDISSEAISIARKKAKMLNLEKKANFFIQDAHRLKSTGKFDIAICIEVLEHVKDDNKVIKNIYRKLKKTGTLIVTVPSKNASLYKLKSVKAYDQKIGHLRRYSARSLSNKLKKNNFKVLKVKKTEGILRNSLFFTKYGVLPLKIINRFPLFAKTFESLDNLSLKLFKESQITIIARK
jgi:ubiquinone biosynthesis O-methyltransferase